MTSRLWVLVVVGGVSITACGRQAEGPGVPAQSPLAVTVVSVVETDIHGVVDVGGVVEAGATAEIAARVMGPVVAVRVAPGDRVRTGAVLVELQGSDIEASARSARSALAQARDSVAATDAEQTAANAALVLARRTHERISALQEKRSATTHELDEAAASLAAAEARTVAAAARAQEARNGVERLAAASDAQAATASWLQVRAPFDGLVTERLVEPGSMAVPGAPLLRIDDTRMFRLEVRLDESRAAALATGTRLDVTLDGDPQAVVTGTVVEIGRAVDAGSRTVLVKIALPGGRTQRSGAFGRVRVPTETRRALTVPATALVHHGQVTSVFVVEGDVARMRLVRVRGTEVQAGLRPGDRVIAPVVPGLVDGRAVSAGSAP